ncbi:hypothetical protein V6N13_057445, partial [Hibiscus sabdariffa]
IYLFGGPLYKMTLEHDEGNGANVFDEGPGENNELNGIDESVNGIEGEDSNNVDGDTVDQTG